MIEIFINYRSNDEPFAAALADEKLRQAFGDRRVFRDNRNLPAGRDFVPELWQRLAESKVLLVLIGPRWLDGGMPQRPRPIDRPDDYVRREIAESLRRNILIIPVLLNDAEMPEPHDLPPDIRALANRQFVRLRQRYPDQDMAQLINAISGTVPLVPQQAAPPGGKSFSANTNTGNAYVAETMTFHDQGRQ